MAATNLSATLDNMASKLLAMGGVSGTTIGEARAQAAQDGLCMIILMAGGIPETVLNAPRERHTVSIIRIENALKEPVAATEKLLDEWRAEVLEDIFGDFDLGGTIAYALPTETTWEYGHVTYNNLTYRYCDITLSFIVDPAARFVA